MHGVAYAPAMAPIQVQRAIWAGNKIRKKPYIWGGGHAAFKASGYDCSGSVSYVLHAAGLLKRPDDSSDFEGWGQRGTGEWITVYTNAGHAFIEIAGIRFDTSAEADPHPAEGHRPAVAPDVGASARVHGAPSLRVLKPPAAGCPISVGIRRFLIILRGSGAA